MNQEEYEEFHEKRSKFIEDIDYRLIPLEQHSDAWGVRFLSGPFIETVIMYYAIALNEVQGHLSYNFKIISTPDDTLATDRVDLQEFATGVLESIIENGVSAGTVQFNERK